MTTQDSTYDSHPDADEGYGSDQDATGRHVGEHGEHADPEVAEGGPTLLPVDAGEDEGDAADYHADEAGDAARDEEIAATPATPGSAAAPVADDAETGTVQGFGHDPVVDTPAPDVASGPAVVTSSPVAAGGASPSGADDQWHELQSHFVDDPADAVRQAGQLVEQALADLRAHLESGDTESLRTTFRRYRELHAGLI